MLTSRTSQAGSHLGGCHCLCLLCRSDFAVRPVVIYTSRAERASPPRKASALRALWRFIRFLSADCPSTQIILSTNLKPKLGRWTHLTAPIFCKICLTNYNFLVQGSRQKKRILYGQADRKHSPPPFTISFLRIFFILLTLYYGYRCSEMDFTSEKSFSSNYKNFQLLLTAAAALSQNSQIAVQQRH